MRRRLRYPRASIPVLLVAVGVAALALIVLAVREDVAQTTPQWLDWLDRLDRTELAIDTAHGATHRFRAYVAETLEQQTRGLMYVRELPMDQGMLFPYDPPRRVSMWMKNTLIPLDMLFIRADGIIANVAERAVPGSLAVINSKGAVGAVLELNGGTAARLRIGPGDRVRHPMFTAPGQGN
jgi:uncharacterized membrane protein (UPF0127 family)